MHSSNDVAEFFKGMADSQLIWHFSSDGNTAKFAYEALLRHLRAAELQSQRIVQSFNYVRQNMPHEPNISDSNSNREYFDSAKLLYDSIFIEIHFYFISWVNCQNMMKALGTLPEFIAAKKYADGKQKIFGEYSEARNTFEHFIDRLPAGKNASRVKETRETADSGARRNFGGIKENYYTFSDKSWDISPKSFELLKSIVREFIDILLSVVTEKCDELIGS